MGKHKNFYTTGEFGSLFQHEPETVRRWIRRGIIEAERVGRIYLIHASQIEKAKARPRPGNPHLSRELQDT